MARPKSSISDRLNAANVAISNAMEDAEIGKYLGERGYQTPQLSQGRALYEAAGAAVRRQVACRGDESDAADRERAAFKEAKIVYQDLAKTARAVFARDKASLAILGLDNPMPNAMPLFVTMASALFDNASHKPEVAAALAARGYSPARLASERARIVELSVAMQRLKSASGDAQQATADQTAALNALGFWMSEFTGIAKVALRTRPQLLEKLGILKRALKTLAQRQAPGKAAATRKANGRKAPPTPAAP